MRCSDNPGLSDPGALASDGIELPLVQDPEKLGLKLHAHVPDLVQEHVPVARKFEVPLRAWTAPVKAPLTWPKSSDSRSVSARAVQLIAMNGSSLCDELKWMARAMHSFPVPVSPRRSTVVVLSERTPMVL